MSYIIFSLYWNNYVVIILCTKSIVRRLEAKRDKRSLSNTKTGAGDSRVRWGHSTVSLVSLPWQRVNPRAVRWGRRKSAEDRKYVTPFGMDTATSAKRRRSDEFLSGHRHHCNIRWLAPSEGKTISSIVQDSTSNLDGDKRTGCRQTHPLNHWARYVSCPGKLAGTDSAIPNDQLSVWLTW